MANLLVDGFDWFPTGQNATTRDRLWAANDFFDVGSTSADVATGRFDFGNALVINNNVFGANNLGYVAPIGALVDTGFIGLAVKIPNDMASTSAAGIQFYDAVNNAPQVTITFEANGVIRVYQGRWTGAGATGTMLVPSLAGSYQEEQWFHVEAKSTIAATGGSVEVRVNTVPVIQLTGANTQFTTNAYFDSIALRGFKQANGATHALFDDLFVNDTSGAENNDWSGNLRVKTQFMIGDGATDQFAIGGSAPASTHWQSVLNTLLDDTKFEFSSTVGQIDLFTPDPNLNSPLVRSLQVRMGLRQDDATQRVARAMLRIAGTNYPGSVDQFTNQTFTFYKERFQLNPATGVSFTGTEVNGLQPGVKVQA